MRMNGVVGASALGVSVCIALLSLFSPVSVADTCPAPLVLRSARAGAIASGEGLQVLALLSF